MITAKEAKTLTYTNSPIIKFIESNVAEAIKSVANKGKTSLDIKLRELPYEVSCSLSYWGLQDFISTYLKKYDYYTDYLEGSKILRIFW